MGGEVLLLRGPILGFTDNYCDNILPAVCICFVLFLFVLEWFAAQSPLVEMVIIEIR